MLAFVAVADCNLFKGKAWGNVRLNSSPEALRSIMALCNSTALGGAATTRSVAALAKTGKVEKVAKVDWLAHFLLMWRRRRVTS